MHSKSENLHLYLIYCNMKACADRCQVKFHNLYEKFPDNEIIGKLNLKYLPKTDPSQLPQFEEQVFCFQRGHCEIFTTFLQIRCGQGFAGRGVAAGLPDVRLGD